MLTRWQIIACVVALLVAAIAITHPHVERYYAEVVCFGVPAN
jgi:hypothetical protein